MANTKLFKALKKGFENAIAHDQGKLVLRSELIKIPTPLVDSKTKDIKNPSIPRFARTQDV